MPGLTENQAAHAQPARQSYAHSLREIGPFLLLGRGTQDGQTQPDGEKGEGTEEKICHGRTLLSVKNGFVKQTAPGISKICMKKRRMKEFEGGTLTKQQAKGARPMEGETTRRVIRRYYAPVDYLLLFFVCSFFGWVWEVGLTWFQLGRFVNRGVLTGPWLPLYGSGAVLVLVLLRRWFGHPGQTFLLSAGLCTLLEYACGWFLERTTGLRWWDYSRYRFDLQGRVSLESAAVFGLGCCIVIYWRPPSWASRWTGFPSEANGSWPEPCWPSCGIDVLLRLGRTQHRGGRCPGGFRRPCRCRADRLRGFYIWRLNQRMDRSMVSPTRRNRANRVKKMGMLKGSASRIPRISAT